MEQKAKMNFTHHSEYLSLQQVILKPVLNAFVSQNHLEEQWKDLKDLKEYKKIGRDQSTGQLFKKAQGRICRGICSSGTLVASL